MKPRAESVQLTPAANTRTHTRVSHRIWESSSPHPSSIQGLTEPPMSLRAVWLQELSVPLNTALWGVNRHLKVYQDEVRDEVYRMMLSHHSRNTRNSNRNINKPQSNMPYTRHKREHEVPALASTAEASSWTHTEPRTPRNKECPCS